MREGHQFFDWCPFLFVGVFDCWVLEVFALCGGDDGACVGVVVGVGAVEVGAFACGGDVVGLVGC